MRRRHRTRIWGAALGAAAALLVLAGARHVGAAEPLALSGDRCLPLGAHVEVLADPGGALTLDDVRRAPVAGRFVPDATANLHLGPGTDPLWLRFRLAAGDDAAAAAAWYLNAVRPYVESLDVWLPRTGCDPAVAGAACDERRHYGFWDRDGLDRVIAVRLPALPATGALTIHARVVPNGHLLLPLMVCTERAGRTWHQARTLVLGLLLGVLLVMAAFGLVLLVALRDGAYAWFTLFEVATVANFVAEPGFLDALLFGGDPLALSRFSGITIALSVIAAVGFARHFLDTRRRAPRFDRVMLGYMAAAALVALALLFVDPNRLAAAAGVLGWLAPVVIIVPGLLCWRRGFAPARLYLLAWGVYGLAAVLASGRGDLEVWAPGIYLGGVAIASLLLTLAIAHRLRALQEERQVLGVAKARVEEALHESEGRYRAIFENAQVGLFSISTSDGRVVEANEAMARMFGFPDRAGFLGFDMRGAWVDPAARERMYATFAENRGVLDRYEAAFRCGDGSVRWFRFAARIDPARGVMEGAGFGVTEERHAAEALRRSERRFRALADASRAITLMTDLRFERFLYANAAALRQLGYEEAELLALSPVELVHPDDRPRFEQVRRAAQPNGPAAGLELRYRTKAGEVRWMDSVGVPVELEEGWVWLVTGLDVTERRRAEKQMMRAEKMAALGVVVAGIAHEINNPNNFIHFNLPILRRYVDAMAPFLERAAADEPDLELMGLPYQEFLTDLRAMIGDMEHGSARITGIVSQLRGYVRGAESQTLRPCALHDVVQNAMTLVGKQVRKMVHRLDVEVAPDLPPVVGDAGKLEQALINLVVNAGQAADKEDSHIRVAVAPAGTPGRVRITVEDNGTGIPEDILPRIFDPFFTTKSGDAGTGLGLGIVERIVDEHGGTIAVESTPGVGTTFTIELPAAPALAAALGGAV